MIALLPFVSGLADWLVTFAIHSTIALSCALGVSVAMGRRARWLQESALRWSMWIAIPSSLVRVLCASGPWNTEFALPNPTAAEDAAELGSVLVAIGGAGFDVALQPPTLWSQWSSQSVICLAAAVAALFGLAWLVDVQRRLRAILNQRQPETDARVLSTAAEVAGSLGLQQSPHVSRTERIATPIAIGLIRPEVCLPRRAGELSDSSLRAMLAHEVAHLRAADPAWMWGAAWLQALFPWQVLFVIVRRRWLRLVELRCDSIASQAASPTAVARCLLDIADWLQPRAVVSVVALGMAARPSALKERIEAALRGERVEPSRPAWSWSLGGVLLSGLSLAAPGVATATAFASPEPATELADATIPEPAHVGLRTLFLTLASEHDELLTEAALLRNEWTVQEASLEQMQLLAELDARLHNLTRIRERLDALLARFEETHR